MVHFRRQPLSDGLNRLVILGRVKFRGTVAIYGLAPLKLNKIKNVSVLHCLHGEIECTNSDVQKRDEQTDRQKTERFGFPAEGEIRAPPNLAR